MSTNGTYEFTKNNEKTAFYCHWDNYPSGAKERLLEGLILGAKPEYSVERFQEKNEAEPIKNANEYGANYRYAINLNTNEVTITSYYCKELGGCSGGGYGEGARHFSFEVNRTYGLYAWLEGKINLETVKNHENLYTTAYKKAEAELKELIAHEKKLEAAEREFRNEERLERAEAMNLKEVLVEVEEMKIYVAKNKYVRIETEERTVVRFVGETVKSGYTYRREYGELLSCSPKTVLAVGGSYNAENSRIKIASFASDHKNKVGGKINE